jgi:tetratricopeptide (TPR) repeat protein
MLENGCVAFILLLGASLPAAVDTPDAHLGKGYAALRQERYETAASEFRAALKLDPSLVMRARFPLAVALFELKQPADARREFEAVRRAAGDHPSVDYYLGRLDLTEQQYASAIRNFEKAVAQPPFSDTAYYLGLAYFRSGQSAAAEKWLKAALRINPHDSVAEYQLALLYRQEGRWADADRAFKQSADLRKRGTEESELRQKCEAKLAEGTLAEARAICDRLYDPDDAEKLTALGTLYGQHGDYEAALKYLSRAAELSPEAPQMQYNLAFTYYRMGRYEDAREALAQAVERWPDLFDLSALYGAILANLGDLQGAYQALHRAHQLNAQDSTVTERLYLATLSLAQANQGEHRYADALRYFKEAAAMKPNDPEPRKGIAEVSAANHH